MRFILMTDVDLFVFVVLNGSTTPFDSSDWR